MAWVDQGGARLDADGGASVSTWVHELIDRAVTWRGAVTSELPPRR
jgi:hypothetical protein